MSTLLNIFIWALVLVPVAVSASAISVIPENPIQGEPLRIEIVGTTSASLLFFDGKKIPVFTYKNAQTAFYGIDLYKKPGHYKIVAALTDGKILEKNITVLERTKIEAPLGIPEKLGGNTQASATTLVNTLAQENASLLNLRTGTHAFWTAPFKYPVANPVITDEYGYQRQTGSYSIAHKGTDFRAAEGTPVLAMNRGVVRLTQVGRNYGKTVVIDHGLGLQTFYMHLSKIYVNEGELVLPGTVIGLSGQTGYADKPHLHVTVRMSDVSIDPKKFLEIFGK